MSVFRTLLMQQDVYNTIYGTNSITFNAKANGLKALTLFGGIEQSGTPTPDAPQDIVCNNGALKYSNNLLDMATENIVLGKYINNSGVVSDSSLNFYNSKYIPVVAGETYTWSTSSSISYFSVMEYDSSYVFKKRTLFSNAGTSGSITLRSDAAFVLIGSNMDSADITLDKIAAVDWQFEKGSSATAYKPYSPTGIYTDGTIETIQDSLSNTATAEMLLKIGNYQDTQEVLSGHISRKIGIKVLDGTESWVANTVSSGRLVFYVTKASIGSNSTVLPNGSPNIKCSHFETSTAAAQSLYGTVWAGGTAINFTAGDFCANLAAWKQWLADQYAAGTPVIMVYPLATATTETVTRQHLTTKAGTNTISITQASISNLDLEAKFKKGKEINTYYAYKDGNNNIIYTKGSTASIDYTLENLTNTNCTDLGDGVYQGGANKYFVTNSTPAIGSANSWEFKTKVKYVPTNGTPCIFGCSANDCQTPIFGHVMNNQIYALLSSNGRSWDMYYSTAIKDIDTQETLTLSTNTTYYFKLGFTGTEYYLWYSTVGFDDTGKTLTFLRTSTKVYCADPLMLLNNNFGLSGYYWGGTIDLTQTKLIVDGVETSFCEVTKSTLYNSSLRPMVVQPDYELGKGIVASDMQNGALILPTQQPVSSMELCVHYKTNSSFPNLQLTGGADDTTTLGLYFQNYNSYLNTWISSNGSSYDVASDVNIASGFVNDTEYWLKATWDGTKYEFYTSTDGINFTKSYQVINSTSPIFWNNSNLYLGNNSAKSFTQVYAKYFLDGTYLKVDGVTVFDGSLGTGYTTDGCTVSGFIKGDIKFNNTVYGRSPADDRQA